MKLTGNRVILRPVEEQDQEMLLNLIEDPETARITGGYSRPASYEHQRNWFRAFHGSEGSLRCIIADKDHPETGLGIILLSNPDSRSRSADIHIKLKKAVREKGYGQDAVRVLAAYGFGQLQLESLHSRILESNLPSRRLFEKCGFQPDSSGKGNVCVYTLKNPHNL